MEEKQPNKILVVAAELGIVALVVALIAWFAVSQWASAAPLIGFLVLLAVGGLILRGIENQKSS